MDGYQATGAGSPLTFLDTTDIDMDFPMDQSTYYGEQRPQFMQSTSFGHSPVEHPSQPAGLWPINTTGHLQPLYQQHWSVSTLSSTSSDPRSSDNSVFSQFQNRASTVSTDSSLSNISNLSRNHYLSQTEYSLTGHASHHSSYAPSPIEGPVVQTPRKRTVPRTPAPEKDYYKTCVSRKQRARRSATVPKYFCTTCKEAFGEKADWKRHEETFQERPEEFQCDLCPAKYFLDKDFVTHHVSHGCSHCSANSRCSEKKHVRSARKPRTMRTGWGCGFCYHFSTTWTERCHHIAHHFDHEGKTMAEWNHSAVIYSLLQRPAMLKEWNGLLLSKKRVYIGFGWDPQSTGRVEGYPDSTKILQLQDELEYFALGQDAAALARKVYDLAVKKVAREPPPVPPKDHHVHHKPSLQEMMKETESLTQFAQSVINDDLFPTGTTSLEDGWEDDDWGKDFWLGNCSRS